MAGYCGKETSRPIDVPPNQINKAWSFWQDVRLGKVADLEEMDALRAQFLSVSGKQFMSDLQCWNQIPSVCGHLKWACKCQRGVQLL